MALVSDPLPALDPATPPTPGYRRTLGFLWWLPLLIALAVGLIVYAAGAGAGDVYVANTLLLTPEQSRVEVRAYADLAFERSVLRETIRSLRIPTSEPELSDALDVEVRGRIVEIKARATEATGAQILLQTLATQIVFQAPDLLGAEAPQIVLPARVPTNPEGAEEARNTGFAVAAGLFGGIVVAGLVARRELRLRNASEFERLTGWLVLGVIPPTSPPPPDQVDANPSRIGLDQAHRELARVVDQVRLEAGVRSVVITAPAPAQGATTLAAGLAAALARENLDVTLIDANLRAPGVHRHFGLPNDNGLADVIIRSPIAPTPIEERSVSVAPTAPPLRLITSGRLPSSPEKMLNRERVAALVEAVTPTSDITLIDAPDLSSGPEAVILAACCDATVVAVASDSIYSGTLLRAVDAVNFGGGPQPGLVVTAAKPRVVEAFQTDLSASDPLNALAAEAEATLAQSESPGEPEPLTNSAPVRQPSVAIDNAIEPAETGLRPAAAIPADPLSNPIHRWEPQETIAGEPQQEPQSQSPPDPVRDDPPDETDRWAPPVQHEDEDHGLPPSC